MSTLDQSTWTFEGDVYGGDVDVVGYKVEAIDGSIGKVDEATYDAGASYVVVDTGPWIFGRRVLLPAGTIERVDWDEKDVYVDRTKDEIKDSPELRDEDLVDDTGNTFNDDYRGRLTDYYGERPGGPGDGAQV
jgi:hypothetical protein